MAASSTAVRSFHLAILEGLELSRRNGCHPVTVFRDRDGQHDVTDMQHGPPDTVPVCRIEAVPKPIKLP